MRTHIIFLTLTALLVSACASHEGRNISSKQEQQEATEYSKVDTNSGRDMSRQ